MNGRLPLLFLWGLTFILVAMIFVSANLGALTLSFKELYALSFNDPLWHVWLNIRLPRVLLAVIVGMALATSGAVMQGLFRNPLADPGLLGISSGSALVVALFIILPLSLPPLFMLYGQMFASFIGGAIICFIIHLFSYSQQGSMTRLILLGVAINALIASIMGILSYISDEIQLRQLSLWSMGHLGKGSWDLVVVSASLILPTLFGVLKMTHRLNILQLGDEDAHYLGLNVKQTKRYLLFLSAILIGAAVAVSGIIAFIGLVIPHMIRLRLGADHRWLIPGSALGGACLLLLADTLARTVVAPTEIPVGLFTSLIGGPYFLWLILKPQTGR